MVANFTVGREKFRLVEPRVKEILSQAQEIRKDLAHLVEKDTEVYDAVSAAYQLPRQTEGEKKKRRAAIDQALRNATEVPLKVARYSRELLLLNQELMAIGNPNLISDVGVAGIFARDAFQTAVLNIEINLAHLSDAEYRQKVRHLFSPWSEEINKIAKEIEAHVLGAIRKD
jgi:formiminotetrahydrofolate cyclodeaminase